MAFLHRMTSGGSRGEDRFGSGQFGASRDHARRTHQGLDLVARAGEIIYSPMDGNIIREAIPYASDPSYRGLVIQGTDLWDGYEVKVFYMNGFLSGPVIARQPIGRAQDLSRRYPGISNHIHVEVRLRGRLLSPNEAFGVCL